MSDPAEIEAAIRDEATRWAKGFDANSLIILAKALRGFDVTAQFSSITSKVLYVLSRTDRLFPPELAPGVMPALKAAGVDADYFLLDSDYGHSATGRDADKWAPRLRAVHGEPGLGPQLSHFVVPANAGTHSRADDGCERCELPC